MVYKITLKSFFSFLVFCLCFVGLGFGQSIFTNPITGTNPGASNPYTTGQIIDDNITVSGISMGPDINPVGVVTNNRYNARSWSTDGILDLNDYFEFTITPNMGYEIDFGTFVYGGTASLGGPSAFAFRSSLDGYTSNIGNPSVGGTVINLTGATYQNITTSITFRFYAWGANAGTGTFSIDNFTFSGTVSALPCASTVTWNGAWNGGTPDYTTEVIIESDYDTENETSFTACSLTVANNASLNIANNTYVEIINDITVDANSSITVMPYGAVVQINNLSSVTSDGTITVVKTTAPLNKWYEYTYWSSPVSNTTVGAALFDSDPNRRFLFKAQNFLDAKKETANNNILVDGQDDVDDNRNDWQRVNASTPMTPGVGYAATHSEDVFVFPGAGYDYTFIGSFNNGVINVPVYRNDSELNDNNWNLIGNPYPSAIDADLFLDANSNLDLNVETPYALDGAIFLWSQNTAPSGTANGNEALNFSDADYAIINGIGQTAGGDGLIPERKIPSGQAFFVTLSDNAPVSIFSGDVKMANVVFKNSMRVRGAMDNSQFFKGSSSKNSSSSLANKLWIDLTSDNGVFNQTLVGYVNGATDNDDGMYFDAPKSISTGNSAILYTNAEGSNKKFAIQGKDVNGLDTNETINLGFSTNIKVATLYTLSIAQLEGDFLTNNTIYLKDNLLGKVHNLSESDYTFTSGVGEFNDRFVVMFNNQSLSTDELLADVNSLKIIDVDSEQVQFTVSNDVMIKKVSIFDILGRKLYHFKGQSNSETYHLSNLKNNIYIAKVELSNGAVITKKAVKK
ncbi:MAG: T9SS type A sorting domain-containing protein [Flavobacteriales bacterium]